VWKTLNISLYISKELNVTTANPYLFDTYKLNAADNASYFTTCRLEYGKVIFYPETEYATESKVRIFNNFMSYATRKNDFNSGTQLNLANFNSLYGLKYFDLSFQREKVTRDPKQLIFRYKNKCCSSSCIQCSRNCLLRRNGCD